MVSNNVFIEWSSSMIKTVAESGSVTCCWIGLGLGTLIGCGAGVLMIVIGGADGVDIAAGSVIGLGSRGGSATTTPSTGSVKVTFVPMPGVLSAQMRPPC